VQREKLVNIVPPIEQFDPSTGDCDVLLRHVCRTVPRGELAAPFEARLGREQLASQ
jgi:hypothetical protein